MSWYREFTLYKSFDEEREGRGDPEDYEVVTYYVLYKECYAKGEGGRLLLNASATLTSEGRKITEHTEQELYGLGAYKRFSKKELKKFTSSSPQKYLYQQNLFEYFKADKKHNYWKNELEKHPRSITANENNKYYDEVMVRFRNWFKSKGYSLPNENVDEQPMPATKLWKKGKKEFSEFVLKKYKANINLKNHVKNIYLRYKFPKDYEWTLEKCYEYVKKEKNKKK